MKIISEKEKIRIDQFLSNELDISRSKIQRLIKEKRIWLDVQY